MLETIYIARYVPDRPTLSVPNRLIDHFLYSLCFSLFGMYMCSFRSPSSHRAIGYRHGFRANFENAHWVAPTGTSRDVPLTAHGVNQARELADHFAASGVKLDMVLSSPYYRCLTSATPVAEQMGLKISIEHGIGCVHGQLA